MEKEKYFRNRQEKIFQWLREHDVFAAIFSDDEDLRDVSIRYFTGHPADATLILTRDGNSILVPWDEILASKMAMAVDKIYPLTNFERKRSLALKSILGELTSSKKQKIQISPKTSHLDYCELKNELSDFELECISSGVHQYAVNMRAVKDDYEIECTRKACSITDEMTQEIYSMVTSGKIRTETDVALYAEKMLREKGCEKTSFDTLAAGPDRSFAIHAFPGYTNGSWGTTGLSILDYGVCYEGYASDCTITIARGPLSKEQEQLLDLVQNAKDECLKLYVPGEKICRAVQKADEIFACAGKFMPHGLGHGTGLEIHEAPFVSKKSGSEKTFEPGNIITLEPGLYDAKLGGVRLENDVLITENGNEVLTNSKIFRI